MTIDSMIATHKRALMAFCLKLTRGNADEADDLFGDTMLKVLRSSTRIDQAQNVRAYLKQAAKNVWIERYRRSQRRVTMIRFEDIDPHFDVTDQNAPTPDLGISRDVELAIARIGSEDWPMFDMRANGIPVEEIAKVLDVPTGTVKSRMNRARARVAA